jgi:hypothetical protein
VNFERGDWGSPVPRLGVTSLAVASLWFWRVSRLSEGACRSVVLDRLRELLTHEYAGHSKSGGQGNLAARRFDEAMTFVELDGAE